jgi:hypothetical protein
VAVGRASALRLQSAGDPDLGSTKSFYLDVNDSSRTQGMGELIAVGEHCYIYVIQTVAAFASNRNQVIANAEYIAEEFDEEIYPMMTDEERSTYFGQPRDVDGNGKLTILYYDISPAETGGFFWGGDFTPSGGTGLYRYSNYADIVYLQSGYLTTAGLSAGLGTLAHEFQHVINYTEYAPQYASRAPTAAWLDEGLSELAREFYAGGPDLSRVPYAWVSSQLTGPGLIPGSGYINWNGTYGNYAAASLLLHQYYYQQSGHDSVRALVTDGRTTDAQYLNSYVEHYKDPDLTDFKSLFRQHALLMTVDSYYEAGDGVYDYDFRGLDVWGAMATNTSAWPGTSALGSTVRLPLQISNNYYSNGPYRYHIRLFQAPADVSRVDIAIGTPGTGEYFVVTPYNAVDIDTQQEFIAVNKMAAQLGTGSATTVTVGSGNLFAVVGVAYASAITATARASATTAPPEPTLESIAITAPASKTVYTVGEPLDLTGLVVTGTYSNGTTRTEAVTAAHVTGFDSGAASASQTLTITVSGRTATYAVQIVEPTGPVEPGHFTVTADKAVRAVRIEGSGYVPGQTLTLWMAYDREPTQQDNDYAARIVADDRGVVDFVLPEEAVQDQPWLGGHVFQVALEGDIQSSEMLLATKVKAHSSARVSLRIKGKAILNFTIDGVLYEFASSNPTLVQVNRNGVVTGVRAGTTIVTLRATDGSGLIHLVTVSVA